MELTLIWICIVAVAICIIILSLFALWFRKRLDNAHAKIFRLEQVEDRRHAFDAAMADKATNVIKLRCKPDENCSKCHGRGHIGKNSETGLFIPCLCCG